LNKKNNCHGEGGSTEACPPPYIYSNRQQAGNIMVAITLFCRVDYFKERKQIIW